MPTKIKHYRIVKCNCIWIISSIFQMPQHWGQYWKIWAVEKNYVSKLSASLNILYWVQRWVFYGKYFRLYRKKWISPKFRNYLSTNIIFSTNAKIMIWIQNPNSQNYFKSNKRTLTFDLVKLVSDKIPTNYDCFLIEKYWVHVK